MPEDAGWNEVERRMAAPWVTTATACLLGALSALIWADLTSTLGPAIGGLLVGLSAAAWRVNKTKGRRSLPLRLLCASGTTNHGCLPTLPIHAPSHLRRRSRWGSLVNVRS
jgi:hypothetical protein